MNTRTDIERTDKTQYREFALTLFKNFLIKENYHLTYERRILFDEIMDFTCSFCVEDLIEKCTPDGIYISRGTIYKTVKLMEEAGVIFRIPKQGKTRYFEVLHPGVNKAYRVCLLCGKMETVDIKEISHLQVSTEDDGFSPVSMMVIMNGICSDCN